MAGINLSGAIGMTGKRESVLSDVPSIIQQTGDYLAKARDEKAKASLLQQQKQAAENNKFVGDLGDIMSVNAKGIKYPDNQEGYMDYMGRLANETKGIIMNPNSTYNDKEKAKQDFSIKASQAREHYLDADKAFDALQDNEKGTLNRSKAANVMAGIEYEQDQNTFQPSDDNSLVTPNATQFVMGEQGQKIKNVGIPFSKMPFEQRVEFLKGKIPTQVVNENTFLRNSDANAVIKSIKGNAEVPVDAWIKETDSNGNTRYKIDDAQKEKLKRDFIYAVESGSTKEGLALRKGIEAGLYDESRRTQMHLNHDERMDFINKGLSSEASKLFDKWAETQEQAKINDIDIRNRKASGGKEEEQGTVIERNVPANQGRVDWIRDDLSKQTKILEEFTPKMLSDYREDYKTADRSSGKYKTAAQKLSEYNTALNAKKVRTQELNEELSKQKKVEDINLKDEGIKINIDGRDVIGVDATGYRKDSQGNVFVYVNVPDADNPKTFVKKVVPYTPDMANELSPKTINSLRKNKFIDENNNEIIAKKSVSSQSTSKPKVLTQEDFNAQWAKLKKGETLKAPNGVTYKKQ